MTEGPTFHETDHKNIRPSPKEWKFYKQFNDVTTIRQSAKKNLPFLLRGILSYYMEKG